MFARIVNRRKTKKEKRKRKRNKIHKLRMSDFVHLKNPQKEIVLKAENAELKIIYDKMNEGSLKDREPHKVGAPSEFPTPLETYRVYKKNLLRDMYKLNHNKKGPTGIEWTNVLERLSESSLVSNEQPRSCTLDVILGHVEERLQKMVLSIYNSQHKWEPELQHSTYANFVASDRENQSDRNHLSGYEQSWRSMHVGELLDNSAKIALKVFSRMPKEDNTNPLPNERPSFESLFNEVSRTMFPKAPLMKEPSLSHAAVAVHSSTAATAQTAEDTLGQSMATLTRQTKNGPTDHNEDLLMKGRGFHPSQPTTAHEVVECTPIKKSPSRTDRPNSPI